MLAHRFARERLKALAQADGLISKEQPEVLFVCVHNSGRSQMAAGLVKLRSDGRIHVRSAGSDPGEQINPAVDRGDDELGVDMSEEFPKPLTDEVVRAADVVITMGCGDACPIYPGKKYEDWALDDPAGQDVETVRRIRDELDTRVKVLIGELTCLQQLSSPPLARALIAEAIGTFALVFAGCGAIMVNQKGGALGQVGVAITFGLVIMVMIYAVGHISGAHFNPAVTFAFALSRHFPRRQVPLYWAAQLAGAVAAAAILRGSLGNIARVGATYPTGSDSQAFLWEAVLTFFLMFVIMAVATDTRSVGEAAAIAIGGTVGLDAMFGGPITGASMNPARSLGPGIVTGDLHAIWIYLLAPIVGAALAAVVYTFLRAEPNGADREASETKT